MSLAFDRRPCPDSLVSRLDPRWKLAALVLAATGVVGLGGLPAAGLALAGAVALVFLSRLPLGWYVRRLGTVAAFLLLVAGPLPFLLDPHGPGWDLGPIHCSLHAGAVALVLCAKGLALVSLMLVLFATAPLDATLKAAHALRVPGLLVQLAVLCYRYIFVVADEWARLRTALRVRGYRNRISRHSYHTLGSVTGTLLVRGNERAERVGQAMRCRGFDGRFRSLTAFGTTAADIIAFAAIVAGAGGLLAWDLVQR
jgi:cobalt/nickel transport system permease protein